MAEHTSPKGASIVLTNLGKLLPDLEPLYKDIHAHPELSMHETRTTMTITSLRIIRGGTILGALLVVGFAADVSPTTWLPEGPSSLKLRPSSVGQRRRGAPPELRGGARRGMSSVADGRAT